MRRGDIRRTKRNGGVPTPTSATTRRHEYHNRGAGGRGTRKREAVNQKWGSGGGSHSASRDGEIGNIWERSHVRKRGREMHSPSKELHKRPVLPTWDGRVQNCDIEHQRISFEDKGRNVRGLPTTTGDRRIFLQEVAHSTIDTLHSYKTYTNVGTAGRGTAMVTRNEITITNITKLPSGRGIAGECRGIWLVNVYARHEQPSDRRENVSTTINSHTC